MKHTKDTKAKAYKYYCLGLNCKEIAKLLDLNYRTVQRWHNVNKWQSNRTPQPITQRIQHQRAKRLPCSRIAKANGVSVSTVYRHLNKAKK